MGLIALPVHLATYRERGVLRRFSGSPVPLWSAFGAHVLLTPMVGAIACTLLALCAVAVNDVGGPASPPGAIAAALLGALAFAAIGMFLGVSLPSARAAQGAGVLLWFVTMLVSGAGPPPELLSGILRVVGDVLPLKHVVILIQDPWLGLGWSVPDTLIVVAFLAVPAALTRRFLR
jgi:ABC-2 type transport system permease protein